MFKEKRKQSQEAICQVRQETYFGKDNPPVEAENLGVSLLESKHKNNFLQYSNFNLLPSRDESAFQGKREGIRPKLAIGRNQQHFLSLFVEKCWRVKLVALL